MQINDDCKRETCGLEGVSPQPVNLIFYVCSQNDEFPAECEGGDGGEVSVCCCQRRPNTGIHTAVSRPLAHEPDGIQRLDGTDARRSKRTLSCGGGAAGSWVKTVSFLSKS